MSHMIMIDEQAIRECIESSIYQSPHFEAGSRLTKAIDGDKSIALISPRLVPHWTKGTLYLLHSRTETGYLLLDSCVFANVPQIAGKDDGSTQRLHVFQRACRFAMKHWNHLTLSRPAEQWLSNEECGVVFPFPKSKSTGFRVTLRKSYDIDRIKTRHGARILFAFAAGTTEVTPTSDQQAAYKRAFEELGAVRLGVDVQLQNIESTPEDLGYHPLVLGVNHAQSSIKYQTYNKWMERLTTDQKQFVTLKSRLPQRIEGPAGTGKTLCLMLRAHFLCQDAEKSNAEFRILFVAHSDATTGLARILRNPGNLGGCALGPLLIYRSPWPAQSRRSHRWQRNACAWMKSSPTSMSWKIPAPRSIANTRSAASW